MDEIQEKPKRNRSVPLDAAKVRAAAAREGINSEAALDAKYRSVHNVPDGREISVIRRAWHGGRVDRAPATRLAECLGLKDFIPLLDDGGGDDSWKRLVTDAALVRPFLRFVRERSDTRLVRLGQRGSDRLPQVPADSRWCLELEGLRGESLLLLLRSESRFFQLAPVEVPGFINRFSGRSLRYPADGWLEFEPADGVGWRELIAVRADFVPMPKRDGDTGYDCGFEDLEQFARRLHLLARADRIAVDTYAFMLTEPGAS